MSKRSLITPHTMVDPSCVDAMMLSTVAATSGEKPMSVT